MEPTSSSLRLGHYSIKSLDSFNHQSPPDYCKGEGDSVVGSVVSQAMLPYSPVYLYWYGSISATGHF